MSRRLPVHGSTDPPVVAHGPRGWTPVQVLAIGVGAGYLVLGVAGVVTTGLPLGHLDRPAADVLGFRHTPLLGLAEIAFGALAVVAGIVAGGARSLMALLGGIATALGVLLLVDVAPDHLHGWLGAGGPYGWLSVIVGVFLVVTAVFLPDVTPQDRRMSQRHVAT
jgi:uncharacterized membrane protein YedE/YeeE